MFGAPKFYLFFELSKLNHGMLNVEQNLKLINMFLLHGAKRVFFMFSKTSEHES